MELLVGAVLGNAARAVPDRLAVAAGPASLTFDQLDADADRLAVVLQRRGVGLGTRVAIWASVPIELAVLWVAVARCGALFAPVSTRLSPTEAVDLAAVAGPSLLVVGDEQRGVADEVAGGLGAAWVALPDLLVEAGALGTHESTPVAVPGLVGTSPHAIFFTSGSTGRPKGVLLSQRTTVLRCHPGSQLEPRGRLVCPFPLFHMAAWTLAMQQWHARDGIVFTAPTGPDVAEAIHRHQAQRVYLIPSVWQRVLDHMATPAGAELDLSCVRFADTGTSATPPALLDAVGELLPGAVRRVFYGSTEAANVAALEQGDFAGRPASCGVPSPLVEVRVADDRELLVRSPLLFDGYVDDEAATEKAFVDGWYRTGDRVEVDGDGFLYVTGRANDVIRTGGEGVDPVEVEAVLLDHPGVADVAVVGVPDPQWGEVVCAVVVADESVPDLDGLRAHCRDRLAPHKHPRRLELTSAIPRTVATRQVQRALLLERLAVAAES